MRQYIRKKTEKRTTEILATIALVIALGAAATTYTNTLSAGSSAQKGLIAEYRFDTGAGNTAYDTAGSNNGKVSGASWTDGIKGKGLKFDGSDDTVSIPDSSELEGFEGGLTISAWVYSRQNEEGDYSWIIQKNSFDGPYYWADEGEGGGRVNARIEDSDGNRYNINPGLEYGRWTHLAVSYKPKTGQYRGYRNGQLTDEINIGDITPLNSNGDRVQIGAGGPAGPWKGKIDNLRINSEGLNQSQIQSIYNSGSWRIGTTTEEDDPSKVLEIPFQHQNSSHVFDTSGYENHGTRENGVEQASSVDCKVGRCYSFDGNDDYVNIGDKSVSTQRGITVMGWFRNPSGSRWISRDRSDYWNLADQGWEISDGGISDINNGGWTSSIPEDEWTHVAATFNGSNGFQGVYLNGKLQASQTLSSFGDIGVGTARDVIIGCNVERDERGDFQDGCESVRYSGGVDQVKIFNRSLSQSEIVEKTEGLDSQGAVLDLQFNRDGGDRVYDQSNEEHHGLIEPNEIQGPVRDSGLLQFDGLDDRVEIPDSGSLDYKGGEFSLSVWFRENDPDSGRLVSKPWNGGGDYNYRVEVDEQNRILFRVEGSRDNIHQIRSQPVSSNETHHVLASEKNGVIELYVDGKRVASEPHDINTWTPNDGDGNRNLVIGSLFPYSDSWPGDTGFSFKGEILEVMRLDYAPGSDSVQRIYESGLKELGGRESSGLPQPVLSQTFDRVEECGKEDTLSCPSGASGKISVDESGEANHGEVVSKPERVAASNCRVGRCLRFDGSNDRVEVPNAESLNPGPESSFALTAWIKANSSVDFEDTRKFPRIVSKAPSSAYRNTNGYQLSMSSGDLSAQIGDGTTDSALKVRGPEISDGDWYFTALSYDRGEGRLFIDGTLEGQNSISSVSDISNTYELHIGSSATDRQNFPGIIDQVRFYNSSLSRAEVWKLYTQGRDRSTSTNGPMKHFTGFTDLQSVTDRVGKDGTLGSTMSQESNDPDVTSGYIGTGLEFDDSNNEYVEVENPVDPTKTSESMSVSFWLKPDSGTGSNAVVEWNNGAHIWQYNSGDDLYFNPTGTCDKREATKSVKLNQWAHYAVLYDAPHDEFRWYVDGNLMKTASESCKIDTSSNKLRLGKRIGDSDALDGKMDEIKIYPYALSHGQIKSEAGSRIGSSSSTYRVPESCKEVQTRTNISVSGVRKIDPDGSGGQAPFEIYCGNSVDGGGWTLLYNYDHRGGTDPDVLEGKWPKSQEAFSHVDGIRSYGFRSSKISEVRFYCRKSNHDREVHYKTKDRDVIQGVLDNSTTVGFKSVANDSAKLQDHSGFLPDAAVSDTGESEPSKSMFGPAFPMYKGGQYHWSVGEPNGEGNRWECDDYPNNAQHDTLHQIWIR